MTNVVPITAEVRSRREDLLRRHLAAHNRGDIPGILATFTNPHLELVPSGRTLDDAEAVGTYLKDRLQSFPDAAYEMITLHQADDAVICEYWMTGTHDGELHGLEPTGRRFRVRMCTVYLFDGADLIGQRVYFDTGTIARQLA
jgi:predicted ester cyclase